MTPFVSLADACDDWRLYAPCLISETPWAQVFRVTQDNGTMAALKLAKPVDGDDESRAPDWLRWRAGRGTVRVLLDARGRLLFEWFDGPVLAELSRTGGDQSATEILPGCIASGLTTPGRFPGEAVALGTYARDLADLDLARLPSASRDDFASAQEMLRALLATTQTLLPLHGDLHHSNIGQSDRGWLFYDPKVVLGDPHFEAASAMQNPMSTGERLADPHRPARIAQAIATKTGLDPDRMVHWGFVLSALSVAWDLPHGPVAPDRLAWVRCFMQGSFARTPPR